MLRAGSCPRGPPRSTSAHRRLHIPCCCTRTVSGFLTQGQRSVFCYHALAVPRLRRVHPGAPCLAQRRPSRNPPHLAPPKTEQSTPAHAPRLGEPFSPRVNCSDWPSRRETQHAKVWERLL